MFKNLKNIDSAFKHVRTFTMVLIIAYTVGLGYSVYQSYRFAAATQGHIYILANGKALEAFSAERKDNIPVEARDHIRMFHYYFFTLDPDEKVIEANITKALYMADNSAEKLYTDLKEQSYYANIISGNISQEIAIDSISLNLDSYPYYFKCFAKEKMTRTTSIVTRSLITQGYLRNVSRSDNNPHGFLIERWETIENKDLTVENR